MRGKNTGDILPKAQPLKQGQRVRGGAGVKVGKGEGERRIRRKSVPSGLLTALCRSLPAQKFSVAGGTHGLNDLPIVEAGQRL